MAGEGFVCLLFFPLCTILVNVFGLAWVPFGSFSGNCYFLGHMYSVTLSYLSFFRVGTGDDGRGSVQNFSARDGSQNKLLPNVLVVARAQLVLGGCVVNLIIDILQLLSVFKQFCFIMLCCVQHRTGIFFSVFYLPYVGLGPTCKSFCLTGFSMLLFVPSLCYIVLYCIVSYLILTIWDYCSVSLIAIISLPAIGWNFSFFCMIMKILNFEAIFLSRCRRQCGRLVNLSTCYYVLQELIDRVRCVRYFHV